RVVGGRCAVHEGVEDVGGVGVGREGVGAAAALDGDVRQAAVVDPLAAAGRASAGEDDGVVAGGAVGNQAGARGAATVGNNVAAGTGAGEDDLIDVGAAGAIQVGLTGPAHDDEVVGRRPAGQDGDPDVGQQEGQ